MTSEELSAYREIGGAIGAIAMTAVVAWRARGRKDLREPYGVDKESQPRLVTRKEWHDVIDVVNAFPGLSARVKRNEARLVTLENDFREHMDCLLYTSPSPRDS